MLRSFYSGISGMRNFQTKLDVVGNNIANVNTVGFKGSRVNFQDVMSQTTQGATAPNDTSGGVNPMQVGLGVTASSIDTNFNNGSQQTTNIKTDLFIDGDGFFVVSPDEGITNYLTRAGDFRLDAEGILVTSSGMKVMGLEVGADGVPDDPLTLTDINLNEINDAGNFAYDSDGGEVTGDGGGDPIEITDYTIGQDGSIAVLGGDGEMYTMSYKMANAVVQNPAGLEKVGNSLYRFTGNADTGNLAEHLTTPNNAAEGSGALNAGFLEMSNVELTQEFTEMIIAQRGFQANSRIITTSDEVLQEVVNLKR